MRVNSKILQRSAVLGLIATPSVSFAAAKNLSELIDLFVDLLSKIIPFILILALAVFFWGLAKFIFSSGDSSQRGEGLQIMTYGVIALFVMVSVWGLVALIQNTVFGSGGLPQF